jgi:hypothetical protein
MGLIYVDLKLSNPKRADLQPIEAEALVDSGSVYLVIPEHIRVQLALEELMTKEVTLADGSRRSIPYVGPIEARFKNRAAYVGASYCQKSWMKSEAQAAIFSPSLKIVPAITAGSNVLPLSFRQ